MEAKDFLGRVSKEMEELATRIDAYPENGELYFLRGELVFETVCGNVGCRDYYDPILEDLNKALALGFDAERTHLALGHVYCMASDGMRAFEEFNHIIDSAVKTYVLNRHQGVYYGRDKKKDDVIVNLAYVYCLYRRDRDTLETYQAAKTMLHTNRYKQYMQDGEIDRMLKTSEILLSKLSGHRYLEGPEYYEEFSANYRLLSFKHAQEYRMLLWEIEDCGDRALEKKEYDNAIKCYEFLKPSASSSLSNVVIHTNLVRAYYGKKDYVNLATNIINDILFSHSNPDKLLQFFGNREMSKDVDLMNELCIQAETLFDLKISMHNSEDFPRLINEIYQERRKQYNAAVEYREKLSRKAADAWNRLSNGKETWESICQQEQATETDVDDFSYYMLRELDYLTEREREIVKLYFGIDQDNAWTLDEIARRFNITRERVRQIKSKAMNRIKTMQGILPAPRRRRKQTT